MMDGASRRSSSRAGRSPVSSPRAAACRSRRCTPTSVPGTGVTGTIRPSLTGASTEADVPTATTQPVGVHAPAPGQWGNAGTQLGPGPAQFSLERRRRAHVSARRASHLDWRLDATNRAQSRHLRRREHDRRRARSSVCRRRSNPMRKLQASLRGSGSDMATTMITDAHDSLSRPRWRAVVSCSWPCPSRDRAARRRRRPSAHPRA